MLIILTSLIVGAVSAVILYFRWHRGTLEKLGIPVVKSHFLFGSQTDFDKVVGHDRDLEWSQTYGSVYGIYAGRIPQIHISDPEIVRQIFIKDFDKFSNRGAILESGIVTEFMDFINDGKWKAIRSSFTPAFTSSKLKRLSVAMNEAVDDGILLIKKDMKAGNSSRFDTVMYQEVTSMAMDMTARFTLNIKITDPRSPTNDFSKALAELFATGTPPSYVNFLRNVLPFMLKLAYFFEPKTPIGFFETVFGKVMAQRKASGQKNEDFIDLLNDVMDKTKTDEFKKLGISERTVVANAIEFFIAGTDGISTSLSAVVLYSSKNPEIARKIYEEVDAYLLRNKGEVSHETLSELKYLNACLQEALRLHPTFTRLDRTCNQDWEYKGLKVPKGMVVVCPALPYNKNPEYYPSPDTFDPERFLKKDKAEVHTSGSFGFGPRMCPGQRYAYEAMLIIGAKLFQTFKFSVKPEDKIEYYPSLFPGLSLIKPLTMGMSLRNEN